MLQSNRILDADEIEPTRKVLNAAAMTYVAATLVAVSQLLHFILMAMNRRSDD
ncbi:MAG: zinc metallopeptidase [Victivallaceae bacterium]